MAGSDMKLAGPWVCPFLIRAKIALCLKGLSYDHVEEDLINNDSELLRKSNLVNERVVLIHNCKPIHKSTVIVQYIDDVFAGAAPSILPSDPYERAVARFWAAYVDDKVLPSFAGILEAKTEEEKTEKLTENLASLEPLEEAFKTCSKGKAFFGGDSLGYVDIALGSFLFWFEALGKITGAALVDAAKTPQLAAWAERYGATDCAKAVVPAADRVLEYAKKLQATWNAAASN